MFSLKQLNNEVVKAIKPITKHEDKRPILGEKLFPLLYANIAIIAKKNSGKTTIINHIINKCVNRNTHIIVFSSTFHKDKSWTAIRKFCKDKKIVIEGYTSLKDDDGKDTLDEMVDALQAEAELEEQEEEKGKEVKPKVPIIDMGGGDEEEKVKKPKKYKYQSPEYMFIFDDLAGELRSKSIAKFIKKHRHFKSKCVLSSQYIHDIDPQTWQQVDYILLLKGQTNEKLELVHKNADLSLDLVDFIKLYHAATIKPYSFLYIDRNNEQYRMNFTHKFIGKN